MVRHGKDYCFITGEWFKDTNTIFTYKSGNSATFRYNDLPSGKYEIRVMAKHWIESNKKGSVPKGFKEYLILISGNGISGEIKIPASVTGWEKGETTLDLKGGKIDLSVTWLNDYCNGDDCVNFQIHSIKLQRVGNSSR